MADAAERPSAPSSLRQLLAADGWAVLAATVATLAVQLGVLLAGLWAGVSLAFSLMAMLAASTVWVALAGPVMAAGGAHWISALFRGGIVADASGLSLLIAWIVARLRNPDAPLLTFADAAEIYCTLAVLSLVGIAAVRCARAPAGRYATGVVCCLALMAAVATPFWINGIRQRAAADDRYAVVAAAAEFNPFYAVSSPIARKTGRAWHQYDLMYSDIRFAQNQSPGPVDWYASVVRYLPVAAALAIIALVRRRLLVHGLH